MTWNVRVNGKWIGTVVAKTEAEARLVALSTFDVKTSDRLDVSER